MSTVVTVPTPAPVLSVDSPVTVAATGANDLDLSGGVKAPVSTSSAVGTSVPARGFRRRRTNRQVPTFLTPEEPTVTLTRIQSGVGVLTFEAACADAIGEFRLGGLYTLRSGATSTVQFASQATVGPAGSTRPIVTVGRGRYQQLTIDLRQSVELVRFLVYLVPGSLQPVNWSGALVVTTFGGARIELPITAAPSAHVQILLSVFNVTGEYVMRAEAVDVPGDLRNSVTAFGFDRIAWLDGQTPVL